MVYLGRPYHFKFFNGCLPQNLIGPFVSSLTHILLLIYTAGFSDINILLLIYTAGFSDIKSEEICENISSIKENCKFLHTVCKYY